MATEVAHVCRISHVHTCDLAIPGDPKTTEQVCKHMCTRISISKLYVTKNTNTSLWTTEVYPTVFMSVLKERAVPLMQPRTVTSIQAGGRLSGGPEVARGQPSSCTFFLDALTFHKRFGFGG